jgi:hypothetical protein
MDSIEQQLAKRDRVRRELEQRLTPAQRLRELWEIRARAVDLLKLFPEGHERFWRRNLRQRAISARPQS